MLSSHASRFMGSIVCPLRRIRQRERNREIRWHETVPSGWAMHNGATSLTHKILEFFYEAMQFQGAERPGRQRPEERLPPGYQPLPERVYEGEYQVLPEERVKKSEKRI